MPPATAYAYTIEYDLRLKMRDGVHLSANLWLPTATAAGETFPAILEMIPYRKDDWRYNFDHQVGRYLAERGYAFCRLDVRGTGSSDGLALDEYTQAETLDGYEVVEWLGAQRWCNGRVGMWGISYGGFTAIQVAALQPPHLKAIIPVYATDDRYLDDVHYVGGCLTVSELAQYAVSMVGMNALPPRFDSTPNWAGRWKARLEHTPPWLLEWLRQQTDGPYWRAGSLAPDYARIRCAIFSIAGWMDSYPGPALRMHQHCVAPRKTLVGNWAHMLPAHAYPGPTLDHWREMERFLAHWLKGEANGVMDEAAFTYFRREYTAPEAFPDRLNGEWRSAGAYPLAETRPRQLYLSGRSLTVSPPHRAGPSISFRHQPSHGTRAALTWGAGAPPTGLARDLRPDEALVPTFTSEPLSEPLDMLGFAEAVLHVSCSHPVASLVVRLSDVEPGGGSALVAAGALNLTHRESHTHPQPLVPDQIYELRVPLKATAYRFRPGHCIRLSVAGGYWPVLWPSPYPSTLRLHQGPAYPSGIILPEVTGAAGLPMPAFSELAAHWPAVGSDEEAPPVWQITEDVMHDTVTVTVSDGGTSHLPDGRSLFTSERMVMTAHQRDPLRTLLTNEVVYRLGEHGYITEVVSSGSLRCTEAEFVMDIQLKVRLNGSDFFQKAWLESVPRRLL